ncbi:MAG: O-antigen ligase family protein [Bacteroidia bacterium]|nr:O-antigen ligase family protein [Bacteroidia bacterium]
MQAAEQTKTWILRLLGLAAFFLPVFQPVSIVSFLLLFIVRFSDARERAVMSRLIRTRKMLWPPVLFFSLHLLGLLWTENFKYAGLDLQIKAPFLLLPFIAGTMWISERESRQILLAFVSGCLLSSMILLVNAFMHFSTGASYTVFFYIDYSSLLMHPTYLSMYMGLAILFLFYLMQKEEHAGRLKFYSAAILFLFIQLILLSARTAEAVAFLVFVLAGFFYLREGALLLKRRMHFAAILLFTLISYLFLQDLNNRFSQVEKVISHDLVKEDTPAYNSTSGRIEIWKESLEILKENWLWGTGTGDIKDELIRTYERHHFTYALEKKLNAHNQFLQSWLALGLAGLITLCLIFAPPLFQFRRQTDTLMALFTLSLLLNAMTESILEVQKGVLVCVFFYSILISCSAQKSPST